MKIVQLTEAKYASQAQEMWFVVDDSDDLKVVGPFATEGQAQGYNKELKKHYGELVALPTVVSGISTPEEYHDEIRDLFDWMNNNAN